MWLRNLIYRRKLLRLTRQLESKLVGKHPIQEYLPVYYATWIKFWEDVKHHNEFIVMPEIRQIDGYIMEWTNTPHVWRREYIRQQAIREAIGSEDYELANIIKNEKCT